MKKIFIFFAIFCAFSANIFAQSALTKSDYEIYAEVLRDIRKRDIKERKTKYSFVILSTTEMEMDYSENYKGKKFRGLKQSFDWKNRIALTFDKFFPVKYKYELINKSEIEKLLDEGEKESERLKKEEKLKEFGMTETYDGVYWKFFYEKYPKSNGYYKFSRIGYSTNKKFAVVTIVGKGSSWSSNTEYLFEKVGNKWVIVSSGGGFAVA